MIDKILYGFASSAGFESIVQRVSSGQKITSVSGLVGCSKSLLAVLLNRALSRPVFFLTLKNEVAARYLNDVKCFFSLLGSNDARVVGFPGFEIDGYRLSPHPEIAEQRAQTLWNLLTTRVDVLVAPVEAALFKTVRPEEFAHACKTVTAGADYPIEELVQLLTRGGYVLEDPVTDVGEFSQRGGILDLFPPNYENPIRVEFFGDTVESIRTYNPETQRSVETIDRMEIVPMREFCPSVEDLQWWAEMAAETWTLDEDAKYLRESMAAASAGQTFPAFEFLLPLVRPVEGSIFDYTPDFVLLLDEPETLDATAQDITAAMTRRYAEMVDMALPALAPEKLMLRLEAVRGQYDRRQRIECRELGLLMPDPVDEIAIPTQPVRKYHGLIKELISDVQKAYESRETILFLLSSLGRAERVAEILQEYDIPSTLTARPNEAPAVSDSPAQGIFITVGSAANGFYQPDVKLHLVTTSDLFDETEVKLVQRRGRRARATFFSDFRDLRSGDYVVHVDHGIGQFQGLRKVQVGDEIKEFMLITYRDDDKVYVPVENLDLIQKYRGVGETKPTLDKLGSASWVKTKARIRKSMRDMAEELLRLYAERSLVEGFPYSPDAHWMREFEDAFEFEETPDQAQAIADMKKDMESPRPMDRLICGDVGYGKTEVAMRGAFKAILDGKQVAVLAPTTVLAFQHYNTFRSRFQSFPVRIEMITRFKSRKEQAGILEDLEAGRVDILIGTHRLLSGDVKFRDLGLLIVDEEQRFGVAHKERLKKLRTQVDILTLSATPIPRTLHMALLGMRDMSIIETPPKDRLAIQTSVVKFDRRVIKSAVELELARKGQVYFVHNRIESIYSIAAMIVELCPQARVVVAHGQMRGDALEKIMLKFFNYEYDVLVATTIIENGLDIPLANTIIIDRADTYGLSELYQLRGRVGRSNRRAYAYLLVPPEDTLSEIARKRLVAIREFSDLGSGFRLAAMDLEIRGAGNLLGGEQHGHINAVGFELYNQLLENTIHELKGERPRDEVKTSINLNLDIRIPEEYISDSNQRLRVYKRIASAESDEELEEIKAEITDRFGKYPAPIENLFEYARLRLLARSLLIGSIERSQDKIYVKFAPESPVSIDKLVHLVSRNKRTASLSPQGVLMLRIPTAHAQLLLDIRTILADLFEPYGNVESGTRKNVSSPES